MVTIQDISEIKHILDNNRYQDIIRGMAGAYIGSEKDVEFQFREPFHAVEDSKRYKYLKIAQEIPSVKGLDDKCMELDFNKSSEVLKLLGKLVESDLQEDEALNDLYDRIIESYEIANGFLILLYHGTYDVIAKTSDGNEIDESGEVYDFLLCAICPVNWDKPGLRYDCEGGICAKQLQNIVGKAETGFMWPAFEERSSNPEKCLFYCQKPKDPQHRVINGALDCIDRRTATENRMKFEGIVEEAALSSYGSVSDAERMLQRLNMAFGEIVESDMYDHEGKESVLTDLALQDLCEKTDIDEIFRERLINVFKRVYLSSHGSWPKVRWLYDRHAAAIAKYEKKKKRVTSVMLAASRVCEGAGQQDLAGEIREILDEMDKRREG